MIKELRKMQSSQHLKMWAFKNHFVFYNIKFGASELLRTLVWLNDPILNLHVKQNILDLNSITISIK